MGLVINTNVPSLLAQMNLKTSSQLLLLNVQRLSSGYRVNSAADDAAGLARADQLKGYVGAISAAMRNSNDGISTLEIADKSAEKITEIVIRMQELAASAAQGTLDPTTRGYYNTEWNELQEEIERIVAVTEFGGSKLLSGTPASIDVHIGFKGTPDDELTIDLSNLGTGATELNLAQDDLDSQVKAAAAIGKAEAALVKVNDARAVFGAQTNRLQITVSNLHVTFTNFQAAESRIRDVDFAVETAAFARNQILVQSGVAVLAQANTLPQTALQLLTNGS